jgi:hypothetical protein
MQASESLAPSLPQHLRQSMHRLIRIGTEALMEILGSVEPSSPNPRRNTSNDFFEALRIGNIVEIRFRFVSSSFPLYFRFQPLLPK